MEARKDPQTSNAVFCFAIPLIAFNNTPRNRPIENSTRLIARSTEIARGKVK